MIPVLDLSSSTNPWITLTLFVYVFPVKSWQAGLLDLGTTDCEVDGARYGCVTKPTCWLRGTRGHDDGCRNPFYTCCVPTTASDVSRISKTQRPTVTSLLVALLSTASHNQNLRVQRPKRYECGRPVPSDVISSRIIGGSTARDGEHPWLAHLKIHKNQCGGAIINRLYIVTAAHCVHKAALDSIVVTVGATDLRHWGHNVQVMGVSEIRIHPYFRDQPKQPDRFDVALIRLTYPMAFNDNVIPVCLPAPRSNFAGYTGVITGWGQVYPYKGSKTATNMKQKLEVPIIENSRCAVWHMDKGIRVHLYSEMICAGYELGGRDACRGDSGGPLVVEKGSTWVLVGLISAGFGCAEEGQPGIYHRVSNTVEWINYYSDV